MAVGIERIDIIRLMNDDTQARRRKETKMKLVEKMKREATK